MQRALNPGLGIWLGGCHPEMCCCRIVSTTDKILPLSSSEWLRRCLTAWSNWRWRISNCFDSALWDEADVVDAAAVAPLDRRPKEEEVPRSV